jgi:hypothetical protein
MKKLQEKLLLMFLNATSSIKSKRQVEWCLHDIYETLYIVFIISGFYAIITWSGWALLLAMLIWLFLMYGFGWFEYKSRQLLLGYLYPEGEDVQELQENQLNNLFTQIDNLIKTLNE